MSEEQEKMEVTEPKKKKKATKPKKEPEIEELTPEMAQEMLRDMSIPDGVTEEQIEAWRSSAPNQELYAMRFNDKDAFVFRILTRFEYKQLIKQAATATFDSPQELDLYNEETIVEKCLVHPKLNRADMEAMKAGIVTLLADGIMTASGFSPLGTPVRL